MNTNRQDLFDALTRMGVLPDVAHDLVARIALEQDLVAVLIAAGIPNRAQANAIAKDAVRECELESRPASEVHDDLFAHLIGCEVAPGIAEQVVVRFCGEVQVRTAAGARGRARRGIMEDGPWLPPAPRTKSE